MKIDLDYLKQHYASMSDEALLAVDRGDLVDAARQVYDEELTCRDLVETPFIRRAEDDSEADLSIDGLPVEDSENPDWMEDGAEVWSCVVYPGRGPAPEAADARAVLLEAGIPCHLEMQEILPDEAAAREPRHQWRILVPGNHQLSATSELDRGIFNEEFENEWRAHLDGFSDEELRAMHPQVAFGGLFDKVERINRAYAEELARRGLSK